MNEEWWLTSVLLVIFIQTLNRIPLTYVEPEEKSANMILNLARVESTGAKWYLIQPFTRQSLMYLCQLNVLAPVMIRLN